jgi:hypothetical protein
MNGMVAHPDTVLAQNGGDLFPGRYSQDTSIEAASHAPVDPSGIGGHQNQIVVSIKSHPFEKDISGIYSQPGFGLDWVQERLPRRQWH